jgi:predicted small secreted protein
MQPSSQSKHAQNERLAAFSKTGVSLAIGSIAMNPILITKTNCQTKSTSMRRFALTAGAAMVLLAGATTSCSTTRGFGRDVEKTGDKIQNAASAAAN